MKKFNTVLSLSMGIVALVSALIFLDTGDVSAEEVPQVVKASFCEMEGYHEIDGNGVRSGYGYEFLHMAEKYANVNFDYVGYDLSWDETQDAILNGEIDVATGAYKSDDRLERFDFSLPIGTSSVNINTRESETRFVADDYSTYDGMKVGLLKAFAENDNFKDFAEEKGFTYRAKYYDDAAELAEALKNGEVDAVATTSLRKTYNEKTLSTFDTQNFYAIVKKGNTELLDKINYAIEQMNRSEGDWQNDLYYEYYSSDNYSDINFTSLEKAFIEKYSNGTEKLIIATDNNWIPFSWKEDGEYYGILPEYFAACMELCGMQYEFYDYEGSVFAYTPENMDLVDLYICYGLPDDNDDNGLIASNAFLDNGAALLQRKDAGEIKTVALCQTNPNLNTRAEADVDAEFVYYEDTAAAKEALISGDVDAVYVYGYDAEYTVNQDRTGMLAFTMMPDDPIEILAVMDDDSDHTLMSILMKCINYLPDTEKTGIVSKYVSFSVTDVSIIDYMQLHPVITNWIVVTTIVLLAIVVYILLRRRSENKHSAQLEEKVNEITQLNDQLKMNQVKLEDTTEEQEAQLEEIKQLNEEQVAQLEEITALNSELEDQQQRLEEARDMAESANNAKTSFLFNMSHDIRTPMNAIIGFTDLLEKHQDEPDKRGDYLKKIQDSSQVLLSIINNVLEMARIEKGTLAVDEVAWSAEQFNDSLYSVFEDMMEQKNIEFTRQLIVEHHYVYCDPIKLREVFINIISNAYKYTEPGGKVNMRLEEIHSDREGYVVYKTTISDTGMGMSEDFLPHLFEEFSRENNTTDNKIEGTGLGMPIVKRLVEFMEGTIEVQSKKGVGSTFIVTIPHKIAEESSIAEQTPAETDTTIFEGKRILLAEDNELNAEIATEILTEGGFKVEHAGDGREAVDMLLSKDAGYYDLILMDVQMPNLNGYEATKEIRDCGDDEKAKIPIIAMTANAFEEDKKDAYAAGMDGHLAKPVNVKELYRALARIFV